MLEYFLSLLILTGAIFTFIGSLGLIRLKDLYTRLHGPTKATTLGVGSLLIASSIYFSIYGENISLHEILITMFLFITAPVSAHLLAKAALHLSLPSLADIPKKEALETDTTEEKDTAFKTDNTEETEGERKTDTVSEPKSSESTETKFTTEKPQTPDQTKS